MMWIAKYLLMPTLDCDVALSAVPPYHLAE